MFYYCSGSFSNYPSRLDFGILQLHMSTYLHRRSVGGSIEDDTIAINKELYEFVERRIQAIFPNTDTADEVMSVVSNTVMIEGGMNVRSSLEYSNY